METLQAYRDLRIPVALRNGEKTEITVPFTMALLVAVEDAVFTGDGLPWFRRRRAEKSILKVFEDFCKPFFPKRFDFSQVQPTFPALFFSHVRHELMSSIAGCVRSMSSTETQREDTDAKTTEQARP